MNLLHMNIFFFHVLQSQLLIITFWPEKIMWANTFFKQRTLWSCLKVFCFLSCNLCNCTMLQLVGLKRVKCAHWELYCFYSLLFAWKAPTTYSHLLRSMNISITRSTYSQCPAGRVFQYRVGSGQVLDKIPGSGPVQAGNECRNIL